MALRNLTQHTPNFNLVPKKMLVINPHKKRKLAFELKPLIFDKEPSEKSCVFSRLVVTDPFVFCVITFEPIEVQTCSAPQNDRQNLVFVKDIKVLVEQMTRNRLKMIGKPADSLLCRLHSIQFSALVYSFLYGRDLFANLRYSCFSPC